MGFLDVMARLEACCKKSNRPLGEVVLVAVTKGHDTGAIRSNILRYANPPMGESRVQEALPKMEQLGGIWHLIGPLQKNKAKFAVQFDLIHSVDSLSLAQVLNRKAEEIGKIQDILVQVNIAKEPQKHGLFEEELVAVTQQIRALSNIRLLGLMAIPPDFEDKEEGRPIYAKLSRLADELGLSVKSMGMSGDFEIAIEEGATLIRVGSLLFEDHHSQSHAGAGKNESQ